jgi:PAS domain S-box-containing protein
MKKKPIFGDAIEELPVAYIEIDGTGKITRANRAAYALYPNDSGPLIGRLAWESMVHDEKQISRYTFFSSMESGEDPPVVRRTLYTSKGQYRIFELHRSIMRDTQGNATGLRVVSFDVTEAVEQHEEAHKARLWMESVLESVADPVLITDTLGQLLYVNPATERLTGWSSSELSGKMLETGMPVVSYHSNDGNAPDSFSILEKPTRGSATVLDRNHQPLRVELSSSPILDKVKGYTIGVVYILRKLDVLDS